MTMVENMSNRFTVGVRKVNRLGYITELDITIGAPFLHNKVLDINMTSMQYWAVLVDDHNGGLIINVETSRMGLRETKVTKNHM